MRLSRIWWLATLATGGSAITLIDVLSSYPELSTLHSWVNASSNVTSLLASVNNFTFLAPTNDAVGKYLSQFPNNLTEDVLEATFQYSLLRGGFPSLSFTNTSQFVATNLINASYANVTGGQAVELVLGADGNPQVVTGNKSIATSTSADIICVGGIVHIIDAVPTIPIPTVLEITAAHLEYFVSILNTGGYLSQANAGYVDGIMDVPDITYFIPNSAEALANFTVLAKNTSPGELQADFQYHIVPSFVGYSSLLKNGMVLKTAQGDNVTITVQDGGDIYVNAARVITSDYIVANGVVHVIDSLLNRSDTSGPPPKPTSSIIAASTPGPTSTSHTSTAIASAAATTTGASSSSSKSLTTGAKAGIGVGVSIAGLLIIAALAWFFLLRKRQERESSPPWDDQSMSAVSSGIGKFYVQRGQVQRQEDMGLDLQSTGMHGMQAPHLEDMSSKSRYSSATGGVDGPSIPPRSPSRIMQGRPF